MKRTQLVFAVAASIGSIAGSAFAEETPIVHVDASTAVVVERVGVGDGERVCHAPCDRPLEPSVYRLDGEGMRASNAFRIPERTAPVKIALETKTSSGFTTGVVLTSLSAAFLVGGLAMIGGAAMNDNWSGLGAALLLDGGGVALLAGSIGVGIPGIYLLVSNLRSRARVLEGDLHVAASRDVAPTSRAFSVPIASGSF